MLGTASTMDDHVGSLSALALATVLAILACATSAAAQAAKNERRTEHDGGVSIEVQARLGGGAMWPVSEEHDLLGMVRVGFVADL